jgi:hypothetical protein
MKRIKIKVDKEILLLAKEELIKKCNVVECIFEGEVLWNIKNTNKNENSSRKNNIS